MYSTHLTFLNLISEFVCCVSSRAPCVSTKSLYQMRCIEKRDLIPTWACSRTFHITIRLTSSSGSMSSGYVVPQTLEQCIESFSVWPFEQLLCLCLRQQICIPQTSMGRPTHISPSSSESQTSRTKRTTSLNNSTLFLES